MSWGSPVGILKIVWQSTLVCSALVKSCNMGQIFDHVTWDQNRWLDKPIPTFVQLKQTGHPARNV